MTAATASLAAVPASPASAAVAPTPVVPAASAASSGATSSLIVGLRSDDSASRTVKALDADPDVQVLASKATPGLDTVTVTVPAGDQGDAVSALRDNPNVTYIEPNATYRATGVTPDDPMFPQQWGLTRTKVPDAWNTTTGSSVVVAVIDTGVAPVSELGDRLLPGYDFVNDDSDATDDNGHGTMASTVIAAAGNNASGAAGICWSCQILPVKVLNANGAGTTDVIARGIWWAVGHGANVINLSLGGTGDSQALRNAVAYAVQQNVVVIASAGNSGNTVRTYPAAIPEAIAVAGSTEADARYSWSNYGTVADPWVDVAAPGLNLAQSRTGTSAWFQGTSSAGPVVAGIAALARSANPSANALQVRSALESQATSVGNWVAKGKVNAAGTVQAIVNPNSLPATPQPDTTSPMVTAITTSPVSPVRGTVTITPTVSDDVAIKSVTATVNGKTLTATSAPWKMSWTTTGLNGSYPITVTARDTSGNVGSATETVDVDNLAPSAEVTLSPSVSGTVPITLANPSSDTVSMDLLVNNKPVGTATTAPWTIDWATPAIGGKVLVSVRTTDRAGNQTISTRTVLVDNTGPTVAFVTPAAGTMLSGTAKVTATASDASGVAKLEVLAGDTVLGEDTTAPYAISFDTTGLDGSTSLVLRATDKLGMTSSITRTVSVDNIAPTITDLGLNPATTTLRGAVKLTPTVADNIAVKEVRVTVPNAKGTTTVLSTTVKPWTVTWNTTGLSGDYPVTATVLDAAGNSATYTRTVTVDNAAPSTAVALAGTVGGLVPITLSAPSADTAKLEVLVNSKIVGATSTAPWTVSWDTTKFAQGTYTVAIRTTDIAGNQATGGVKVVVDNSGPSVVWSAPTVSATPLTGTVTVSVQSTDVSGVAKVELLSGDTVLGEDTTAPYAIAVNTSTAGLTGSVPLTIRATDKLGMVTNVTKTFVVDNEAPTVTGLGYDPTTTTLRGTARIAPVVADNIALKQIRMIVPTAKGGTTTVYSATKPWILNWTTTGLTGTYPVTIIATDTAGNSTTLQATVKIDNSSK